MPEPIFMELGTYVMASEPISKTSSKIPPISDTNITASQIFEAKLYFA
jgi:hypothetical protein